MVAIRCPWLHQQRAACQQHDVLRQAHWLNHAANAYSFAAVVVAPAWLAYGLFVAWPNVWFLQVRKHARVHGGCETLCSGCCTHARRQCPSPRNHRLTLHTINRPCAFGPGEHLAGDIRNVGLSQAHWAATIGGFDGLREWWWPPGQTLSNTRVACHVHAAYHSHVHAACW